jgi:hypothetical protein
MSTGPNTTLNHEDKKYAIVDGRQRFEAVFEFFDGKFTLSNEFEYIQQPSLRLGGLSYRDLQQNYPKISAKYDNYNLTVMSIITDDAARINDLFVRLNSSKPLTGSELRNAMRGEVPALIRALAKHEFFGDRIRFATNRMQDDNAAAKLLLIEQRGRLTDTKKVHLDRLIIDESVLAETVDIKGAADRASSTLDEMSKIFTHKDRLLTSQGPVTVYYWLIRDCVKNPRVDLTRIRAFLVVFNGDLNKNKQDRSVGLDLDP